jgi:hypothetical protein
MCLFVIDEETNSPKYEETDSPKYEETDSPKYEETVCYR